MIVASYGYLNRAGDTDGLRYPTAAVEHNMSGVMLGDVYTVRLPFKNSTFVFVTDTGNDRIVVFNTTEEPGGDPQLIVYSTYPYIGTPDERKLNMPWGIDVFNVPAWEYETLCNVFVADRMNNRVIKFNFGFPPSFSLLTHGGEEHGEKPMMRWSGVFPDAELDTNTQVHRRRYGLTEPTRVVTYRHYVLVSEHDTNRITVLTPNYLKTDELRYFTHLSAEEGVRMRDGLISTFDGFVFFPFERDRESAALKIGIAQLPEDLITLGRPTEIEDWLSQCVNITNMTMLLINKTSFEILMSEMLDKFNVGYVSKLDRETGIFAPVNTTGGSVNI